MTIPPEDILLQIKTPFPPELLPPIIEKLVPEIEKIHPENAILISSDKGLLTLFKKPYSSYLSRKNRPQKP